MCTVKFRQMHEDQPPRIQCIVWCCNLHRPKQTIENLMNIHISSAPHSPRRQKLNLRMKSLSLDSPESTEHAQRRKHHGAAATSDPHSNQSSSSRIQCRQNARKIYVRCRAFFLVLFWNITCLHVLFSAVTVPGVDHCASQDTVKAKSSTHSALCFRFI